MSIRIKYFKEYIYQYAVVNRYTIGTLQTSK